MRHQGFRAALLLCAALLPALGVSVRAAEAEEDYYAQYSWDEIVEQLLTENAIPEGCCALGYKNTVTGEERYYNPDLYFTGASLYKAPLNMYYAERITRGEYSWDDEILGVPYSAVQGSSLTYSNNPYSLEMVNLLGGWPAFRADIAPYVGADAADEDYLCRGNAFTARQCVQCMSLLATESERFPGVVDCLLASAPGMFLKYADVPYDIAQKYGNNSEEGHLFHVQGIVFTEDPIVLVVLTAQVASQRGIMAGFTERMCGYTEYHRARRLAAGAAAKPTPEPTPEPTAAPTPEPTAEPVSTPSPAASPEPTAAPAETMERNTTPVIIAGAALLAAALAAGLFAVRRKSRRSGGHHLS